MERSFVFPEPNGAQKSALDKIRIWLEEFDERPIYFLYGSSGTGKTFVANTLIRDIHDSGRLVVSFFCSSIHPVHMIPTLAAELVRKVPGFRSNLVEAIQGHYDKPFLSLSEVLAYQMDEFIFNPLKKCKTENMVIVIDGLDQLYEGYVEEILAFLKTVLPKIQGAGMKFIITSSLKPCILMGSSQFQCSNLDLPKLELNQAQN